MSDMLELDLASRLERAEERWLAQCDVRLRRAHRATNDHHENENENQEVDR